MSWTDPAHVELLKSLWVKGLSASEIADRLNRRFSSACYSRAAVLGKLSRLKLLGTRAAAYSPRGAPKATLRRAGPPRAKPAPPPAPTPAKPRLVPAGNNAVMQAPEAPPSPEPPIPARAWAPLPGTTPVKLVDRAPFTCRWPIDVPGEDIVRFCGCVAPTDRYCEAHSRASAQKDRSDAAKAADAARREKMRARFLRARAAA